MRREDIGSSLFWMVISIGFCYGGYDLGLGTLHEPGSGFIFFWVGLIMIGLSMGILVRAMRADAKAKEGEDLWSGIQWWKIISLPLSLFIYDYILTDLGFILSTTLLLVFLFRGLGPQPWFWAVVQGISSTLITYLIFGIWLGVQFPRGFLGIG
jgi:putative tricarboxylic transport membrane protein